MRKIAWIGLRFLAALMAIVLAGCISMQSPDSMPHYYKSWPQRKNELMRLSKWEISGALSIQYAGQTQLANYVWQQNNPKNYMLTLSGPLSIGAARLVSEAGVITLNKANGEVYTAKSPEALMQAQLGWQLPLHNLYYWVRGLPAPGIYAKLEFDKDNYLLRLQQQGWRINYLRFHTINGMELPVLMTLINKQLHAKIVIKQWQIN